MSSLRRASICGPLGRAVPGKVRESIVLRLPEHVHVSAEVQRSAGLELREESQEGEETMIIESVEEVLESAALQQIDNDRAFEVAEKERLLPGLVEDALHNSNGALDAVCLVLRRYAEAHEARRLLRAIQRGREAWAARADRCERGDGCCVCGECNRCQLCDDGIATDARLYKMYVMAREIAERVK